jgi:hypothetical protein
MCSAVRIYIEIPGGKIANLLQNFTQSSLKFHLKIFEPKLEKLFL